jgi:hypothetical protein
MKYVVGIWIDHRRAVVVKVEDAAVESISIDSDMEKRVRASGGWRGPAAYSPQDVVSEDRIDRRYHNHLLRYFEKVRGLIGDPEAVLLTGPAQAKQELKSYLASRGAVPEERIVLDTTDKLTEPQVVSMVRAYFKVRRSIPTTHRSL